MKRQIEISKAIYVAIMTIVYCVAMYALIVLKAKKSRLDKTPKEKKSKSS